jgi:YidC/Oxa1 family membrane protein insertase
MNFWDYLILNPMINTLLWMYSVLWHNFGLAIIVFTLLVRLITYPLTAKQMKSAQAMQEMQKSKNGRNPENTKDNRGSWLKNR